MIDIYDEEGYIQNVLQYGFSVKWRRDASLLIKYYKTKFCEGEQPSWNKKWVKETILKKCENNVQGFNIITDKGKVNSLVDSVWKNWKVDPERPEKSSQLRKVKQIEFPKEVLDWFLGLEDNFVLTPVEREEIQAKNKKKVSEKPLKFSRVKYLFTLFVWSKIQETYLENYNVHYLRKYSQKFRNDADLGQSFSFMAEKELLSDLGLIEVNRASGIKAIFMELPVFKTPITNENRILLGGEDLYNCGYWLKKQRNGYFICQHCGKEIANDKKGKNPKGRRPRKYCKDCSKKIEYHNKGEIRCIDCGKILSVNSVRKYNTNRCASCQADFRAKWEQERYEKNKNSAKLAGNPVSFFTQEIS